MSASELGRALGKHRNTIRAWVAAGCPHKARADRERGESWSFDLADVVRWREAQVVAKARAPLLERVTKLEAALAGGGDASGVSEAEARRRKRLAEALLLELELSARRGLYFVADDVEALVCVLVHNMRDRLLAMGMRLGPYVALETQTSVCQSLIDEEVRTALTELANAAADPVKFMESGYAGIRPRATGTERPSDA